VRTLCLHHEIIRKLSLSLACAREHAVDHALGDHSVAEDGFGRAQITVYADRPHASLVKAAAIVGIGKRHVVPIPPEGQNNTGYISDSHYAAGTHGKYNVGNIQGRPLDMEWLRENLLRYKDGRTGEGAVVSLSFGEVNTVRSISYLILSDTTGAFFQGDFTQQIKEIRKLCDECGAWLHIDAGMVYLHVYV
jgi:hypothetical protein